MIHQDPDDAFVVAAQDQIVLRVLSGGQQAEGDRTRWIH